MVEPDRPVEPRADTAGGSTLSPQGGRVTPADQPAGNNITDAATMHEPAQGAHPTPPSVGNL